MRLWLKQALLYYGQVYCGYTWLFFFFKSVLTKGPQLLSALKYKLIWFVHFLCSDNNKGLINFLCNTILS